MNPVLDVTTLFSLLDQLHEGVMIHNEDRSISYANTAASAILGISHQKLLSNFRFDDSCCFLDESLQRLAVHDYPVNQLFRSKSNLQNQTLAIRLTDSSLRWIDVNASMIHDHNNKQMALILLSDITSQKAAYDKAFLFQKVIESVDTGVTIADPNQDGMPLIYANPAFSVMTGYDQTEAIGKNCRYLQGKNRDQAGRHEIAEALKNGISCNIELENYTKEGNLFYNLLTLSPLKKDDTIEYYVGIQHNITHIKEQENLLKKRNTFIQSILDFQEEMILIQDTHSLSFANRTFLKFFNAASLHDYLLTTTYVCDSFVQHPLTFSPSSSGVGWIDEIQQLSPKQRIIAFQKKKQLFYMKVVVTPIDSTSNMIVFQDITESLMREQILKTKAYHDPLTGLYNRQYFYDFILQHYSISSDKSGIIIADLDFFKKINDNYGHGYGDEVLKQTANIFQSSLRDDDVLIRWGGEEFLIFIKKTDKMKLHKIGENLCKAVSSAEYGKTATITASLGAAIKYDNESIDSLISRADRALYKAKSTGRNRFVLDV